LNVASFQLCYLSAAMSDSPVKTVRVDRYMLAEIGSSRSVADALAQVGASIQGIRNTEPLLARLLEQIFEFIPAERGAVLLSGVHPQHLEPAAFRGLSFELKRELPASAFRDRTAILVNAPNSILCVPLWLFDSGLGVIYLDSGRANAFTVEHLHLLIAVAGQAAAPLDYTRHIDSLQVENQQLLEYADVDHGLVGDSPVIADMRALINKVAASDSSVLILGEMGTGKELVARGIHRNSRRSQGPFMAINCAAIPETLVESELFGHERGAFSGAVALKKGKVEEANGGTLFLDEVGELRKQTQAALLRFLQEREFQRVGGTRTLRTDVRVVAATNRELNESMDRGDFRGDLYYRLNVVEFRTPSLREMRQDIPRLVEHFIQTRRHIGVVKGISPEALERIVRYDWPGNVRQLQNAIDHALVNHSSEFIQLKDLPMGVTKEPSVESVESSLESDLRVTRNASIERAIQDARGNLKAASVLLGISTRHLRRLMQERNVKMP
jgi:transcriptional regulator with PAS, ATPase and Fis domain